MLGVIARGMNILENVIWFNVWLIYTRLKFKGDVKEVHSAKVSVNSDFESKVIKSLADLYF